MEEAHRWIANGKRELDELMNRDSLNAGDAWRALVLIARLLQSSTHEYVLTEMMSRLIRLKNLAYHPDAQEVLEQLADLLDDDDEDPFGLLCDAILNVDDTASVLWLFGDEETAEELIMRAAGLLSLSPERVLELGDFATMRLETICEDHVRRNLWQSVEAAPAMLLVNALPFVGEETSSPPKLFNFDAHEERGGQLISFPTPRAEDSQALDRAESEAFRIPQEVFIAAAASSDESANSHSLSEGLWLYESEGQMVLEHKISNQEEVSFGWHIVLFDKGSGEELVSEALEFERSGQTLYAELGPWSGEENRLQRLLAQRGRTPDSVTIKIRRNIP